MSIYRRVVLSLKPRFAAYARARRTKRMIRDFDLKGGERIIDLGGTPSIWMDVPMPLQLVIVNLPGTHGPLPRTHHEITLVDGDACNLAEFADNGFDIAFSNSVIEHVGDAGKRAAMAAEVRRLAPRYWVQTPSIWFPIEAHTYLPFWWFYPAPLKRAFVARWRRNLPEWCVMIEGTTVVSLSEIRRLFPEAEIWTERVMGWSKSYVARRL